LLKKIEVKVMPENLISNAEEKIIKTVRQSWLTLLISLLLPVLLIGLSFFFLYPLFNWGNKGIFIFSAILIIGSIGLIRNVIIWYWNTLIITNQKIVDIDQKGIFQKMVSDIQLGKIQDVFYQIKGIGQTLTQTGNLYISLANTKTKIKVNNIARPQKIQQLILELKADKSKEDYNLDQLSAHRLLILLERIKTEIGKDKFDEILNKEKVKIEEN